MKKRIHVWISGLVKGVFFRASIDELAKKLGIRGFTRNNPDGVEAVFEGNHDNLDEMLAFCKKGPKFSKVHDVKVKEETFTGEFRDFKVLHF